VTRRLASVAVEAVAHAAFLIGLALILMVRQ
jgi:hypothetical protein